MQPDNQPAQPPHPPAPKPPIPKAENHVVKIEDQDAPNPLDAAETGAVFVEVPRGSDTPVPKLGQLSREELDTALSESTTTQSGQQTTVMGADEADDKKKQTLVVGTTNEPARGKVPQYLSDSQLNKKSAGPGIAKYVFIFLLVFLLLAAAAIYYVLN